MGMWACEHGHVGMGMYMCTPPSPGKAVAYRICMPVARPICVGMVPLMLLYWSCLPRRAMGREGSSDGACGHVSMGM